jgi:hypothetical protein
MNLIAYFNENGKYLWVGTDTILVEGVPPPPPNPCEDSFGKYHGKVEPLSQYHDILNDHPVDMPERPSIHHVFDYTNKQWVASPDLAWASVKQQRARLLAGSDWMVTKATEYGQSVPPEWIAYRQALRDITLQSDPWAIVWPVAP